MAVRVLAARGACSPACVLAFLLYRKRESDPLNFAILRNRFYIDEFYRWLIRATQDLLARIFALSRPLAARRRRRRRSERRHDRASARSCVVFRLAISRPTLSSSGSASSGSSTSPFSNDAPALPRFLSASGCRHHFGRRARARHGAHRLRPESARCRARSSSASSARTRASASSPPSRSAQIGI